MSRHHYNKSYNRKVGSSVCAASIQFDKLFKENSNRPSAAKSAGTVGKWGVTSFTSIRGTAVLGAGGNNSVAGVKRGISEKSNDAFAFEPETEGAVAPPVVKPKKFFKSRNAEPVPLSSEGRASSVGAVYGGNVADESEVPIRPMRTAASRKMVVGALSPPESRTPASTPSASSDAESAKPPIVLRIFKGTSQLITTPSTPTSPESEFDLHLIDDMDTTNSSGRGKQANNSRTKRARERKEKPREESPEMETVLRVNTAISRAQRYSRRQAAMENSENESDHVAPIPVPKKAARGRMAAEQEDADVVTTSQYNIYSSPAENSSSHDESDHQSPAAHSYNSAHMQPQFEYNGEAAPPAHMASSISTARSELHSTMMQQMNVPFYPSRHLSPRFVNPWFHASNLVPSPALPETFMETDSPTPDHHSDPSHIDSEQVLQRSQPHADLPAQPVYNQTAPAELRREPTALYGQVEAPELYNDNGLRELRREGSTNYYDHGNGIEQYSRIAPTAHYNPPDAGSQYGQADMPVHYNSVGPAAHYSQPEPDTQYGEVEYARPVSSNNCMQPVTSDGFVPDQQNAPSVPTETREPHAQSEQFGGFTQTESLPPSDSNQSYMQTEHVAPIQPPDLEPASVDQFEHMSARDRFVRRSRNTPESGPSHVTSSAIVESSSNNSDVCSDGFSSNAEGGMSGAISSSNSAAPRKKGSIFKSRALQGSDESKKRLALYKHKWCDNQDGSGPSTSQPSTSSGDATSESTNSVKPSTSAYNIADEDFEFEGLTRVTASTSVDTTENQEAVTSVKCSKNSKGFYTVVRNVKKAHQIQESGEFQEFNDDVEYILDALQEQNPVGTRCLSAITLASKCMVPAFRMHVRAHGTVAKFFKALHDAARDQSLGLCTATVMFALSQDRLNMDLDRDSLELMLNLLESDASHRHALEDCGLSSTQLWKNKQKVRELCAEIQSQGHAKHLNLDNITVGQLAMETLLSLTSRRAGEWFKEELRELGGLEHIVRTIYQCSQQVTDYVVEWTDSLLDRMRKIDRCLRVLENVTQQNEENQMYLLRYMDGALVDVLVRLLRLCGNEVPLYPVYDPTDKESTGVVIREALLAVLKVLINLSHDFKGQMYGSTLVGAKEGLMMSTLHMLLHIPEYIVEEKKFDLIVLALTLMINLMEHNAANRQMLINTKAPAEVENMFACEKSAIEALIAMFHRQEEFARSEEAKTDAILDGKDDETDTAAKKAQNHQGSSQEQNGAQRTPPEDDNEEQKDEEEEDKEKNKESKEKAKTPQQQTNKSQDEFIEETVAKLLAKAGRHMEHTFVGAYIALLLGYVIMNNKSHEDIVRHYLPEHNFKVMVAVLQKFFNFMNLTVTATGSSHGLAATETVIKYMAKIDEPPALEESRSEGDMASDDLDGSVSS